MAIIYLITNQVNGKKYVGVTKRTIDKRWNDHVSESMKGLSIIHKAIRKYGIDPFTIKKIYQHSNDEFVIKVAERHFIEEYGTHITTGNGYNMTWGGEGVWGYRHTKDTKSIIASHSYGNCRGVGYKHSKHAKLAISKSLKGNKRGIGNTFSHTEDVKRKISKSKTGTATWCYQYKVTFPCGEESLIENMAKFCREHGLNTGSMSLVVSGKQKAHKGFRAIRVEV